MRVEAKLDELGLVLPEPPKIPPEMQVSFVWVRVHQDRAYVAGHGPQNPDGSVAHPLGKVGAGLSPEEGYQAARPHRALHTRRPQARAGRPRPGDGLAHGIRLGQRRARLHPNDQRDKRLLGPDRGAVRAGDGGAAAGGAAIIAAEVAIGG